LVIERVKQGNAIQEAGGGANGTLIRSISFNSGLVGQVP
jgi:hypothetical protein